MDKQLSKEDILDNQEHGFNSGQKKSALRAMDIFAKQEAIAFAEFILDNSYTKSDKGWYQYFQHKEDLPCGAALSYPVYTFLTIEELYSLYQSK